MAAASLIYLPLKFYMHGMTYQAAGKIITWKSVLDQYDNQLHLYFIFDIDHTYF